MGRGKGRKRQGGEEEGTTVAHGATSTSRRTIFLSLYMLGLAAASAFLSFVDFSLLVFIPGMECSNVFACIGL